MYLLIIDINDLEKAENNIIDGIYSYHYRYCFGNEMFILPLLTDEWERSCWADHNLCIFRINTTSLNDVLHWKLAFEGTVFRIYGNFRKNEEMNWFSSIFCESVVPYRDNVESCLEIIESKRAI